jgi:hypothetical protein
MIRIELDYKVGIFNSLENNNKRRPGDKSFTIQTLNLEFYVGPIF